LPKKEKEASMNEYEDFINGLAEEKKKKVMSLLSTVSMQAELIDDLSIMLSIHGGADKVKDKVSGGLSLAVLAAKLDNPRVKGPTVKEIRDAAKEMNDQIRNAVEAIEVLESIFKFAIRVAPLALV
jgi:hypothetical protein